MTRIKFARIAKILALVIFTYIGLNLLSNSSTNHDSIDNESIKFNRAILLKDRNYALNSSSELNGVDAVFHKGKLGNYEPILKPRSGPGENGEGVELRGDEIEAGKKSVREYGFNMVASEKISMDRRVMDTRDKK